ncbi:MAG: hypothetical protein Q8O19_04175, partial [Rectinemataceae bacterium]|nr:hypothetical protein [Rectinemataceae bacterium]
MYSVTFTAGTNGSISGSALQTVAHGKQAEPVTAVPSANFAFTGWTGSFTGTDNPLVISNVISDMAITANFVLDIQVLGDPAGIMAFPDRDGNILVYIAPSPSVNVPKYIIQKSVDNGGYTDLASIPAWNDGYYHRHEDAATEADYLKNFKYRVKASYGTGNTNLDSQYIESNEVTVRASFIDLSDIKTKLSQRQVVLRMDRDNDSSTSISAEPWSGNFGTISNQSGTGELEQVRNSMAATGNFCYEQGDSYNDCATEVKYYPEIPPYRIPPPALSHYIGVRIEYLLKGWRNISIPAEDGTWQSDSGFITTEHYNELDSELKRLTLLKESSSAEVVGYDGSENSTVTESHYTTSWSKTFGGLYTSYKSTRIDDWYTYSLFEAAALIVYTHASCRYWEFSFAPGTSDYENNLGGWNSSEWSGAVVWNDPSNTDADLFFWLRTGQLPVGQQQVTLSSRTKIGDTQHFVDPAPYKKPWASDPLTMRSDFYFYDPLFPDLRFFKLMNDHEAVLDSVTFTGTNYLNQSQSFDGADPLIVRKGQQSPVTAWANYHVDLLGQTVYFSVPMPIEMTESEKYFAYPYPVSLVTGGSPSFNFQGFESGDFTATTPAGGNAKILIVGDLDGKDAGGTEWLDEYSEDATGVRIENMESQNKAQIKVFKANLDGAKRILTWPEPANEADRKIIIYENDPASPIHSGIEFNESNGDKIYNVVATGKFNPS